MRKKNENKSETMLNLYGFLMIAKKKKDKINKYFYGKLNLEFEYIILINFIYNY